MGYKKRGRERQPGRPKRAWFVGRETYRGSGWDSESGKSELLCLSMTFYIKPLKVVYMLTVVLGYYKRYWYDF
jgi:hypothetical protein